MLTNANKTQIFLDYCKNNIRPVLSINIIAELIRGLTADQSPELLEKKKEVLRVFQKLDLLWALPINVILDLEYSNLYAPFSNLAHNYLRIFSQYPLIQCEKNHNLKHYPCDQNLKYNLRPDDSTVENDGDIGKWLEAEMLPALDIIKEDHEKCKIEITHQINDKISKILLESGKACMDYSPFIFIWEDIRQLHKKKLNDRLDAFYGAFALSYCDYFVVDDEPLYKLISNQKDKRSLKVEVIKSEKFFEKKADKSFL